MHKQIVRRTIKKISHSLPQDIHPVLQHIYLARNVDSSHELEKGLDHLLPFNTLKGLDDAVAVLFHALQAQERILIIGDFDADGATSTALAVTALRALGAKQVSYLVPNRFEYGYGLTPEIVAVAAKWQPDLLITVDNGIASFQGVEAAKSYGMKVLITDHHLPAEQLPPAEAIVNPNQQGCEFPSKYLAGVGVIFYVMLAFRSFLRNQNWFTHQNFPEPNMGDVLDFVALGTYADLVPLDKNNRILINQGLQRIRSGTCRPGLQALIKIAGRNPKNLLASDLGFALAPRLNAAGRLDDMSLGIECLLADNLEKATEIAQLLDELNRERRTIERDMQQEAMSALSKLRLENKNNLPVGLCLYDENWHQGVIGILAARIKEQMHRPVIAFANSSVDEIKGSARSIEGLHIRDILDAIATRRPGLINKFGGHAMAAGLTLNRKNYALFCTAFDEEVRKHLSEELLCYKIYTDGELTPENFTVALAELIHESGPWGQAFPEPVFDGKFLIVEQRLVGGRHLKLTLGIDHKYLDAIFFNVDLNQWPNNRCRYVNAVYRLDINEYRGARNLQLIIEHLEPLDGAN